jgi:glycosyltransferase involved in cell wall biosynthesis
VNVSTHLGSSSGPNSISFSVVVPVRDGSRFLKQALDSVTQQTLGAWECIIIDDGSLDDSHEIAVEWASSQTNSVRTFRHPEQPTKGPAQSRNLGIRQARAPWIAFLDQDDVWLPEKLERQAQFIRDNPEAVAVGCLPEIRFDGVDRLEFIIDWQTMIEAIDSSRARNLRLEDFVAGCPFCMSGVVAQKSALESVGGFEPSLPRTSDWLMWARLAAQAPLGLVRARLVTYRVHGDNDLLNLRSDPLGMVRALLDVHEHLADCLAKDRGLSRHEALALIQDKFLRMGTAWYSTIAADEREAQSP